MVSVTIDKAYNGQFIIRPNRSLSARANRIVFLGIFFFSMVIALGFSIQGLWPILPFAGLELLALGVAMTVCARHGQRRDVITVDGDVVEIEKLLRPGIHHWRFHRSWARVLLKRPHVAWYPSQLVIRSHGREVALGEFLTEPERRQLAVQLKSVIKPLLPGRI